MQVNIWVKVLISLLSLGLILLIYFLSYEKAFKYSVNKSIPKLQS